MTRKTTPAAEPCRDMPWHVRETEKTENGKDMLRHVRETEPKNERADEPCRDMPRHVRKTESGEKHDDDDALDELRQKTIRRLTRLIQEEDNVERLAKLLKILCDIRSDDTPATTTAPTLIEKLQNISRQQQNQQPV